MSWMLCENCGTPVWAEPTHNGVLPCLHYVHCGWGHGPFSIDDGYSTKEEAEYRAEVRRDLREMDR